MSFAICCLLSFLIGGIPFGYLVGRFVLHDDIRNHGSGNIGATNVGRVIGWKWGSFVLLLDALKGLAPTGLAWLYATENLPEAQQQHFAVAAGISAIMGHMYPVYLKLRGGKGVATALGVVLVLAPKASCAALVVFIVTVAAFRLVALSSMLAALTFGVTKLGILGLDAFTLQYWSLTSFAIAVPLLIVWRHRSNISRLLRGTEPAFATSSGAEGPDEVTDDNVPADEPSA